MACGEQHALYLRHDFVSCAGLLQLRWKCHKMPGGLIQWSLRPILDALQYCGLRKVPDIMKPYAKDLKKLCEFAGLDWSCVLIQSKQSRAARQQSVDRAHHPEWTLTTQGVLLFVSWMSMARRTLQGRQLVVEVMLAWLDRLCPSAASDARAAAARITPENCFGCPNRCVVGICRCARRLVAQVEACVGPRGIPEVISATMAACKSCPGARSLFRFLIVKLSDSFAQNCNPDYLDPFVRSDDLLRGPHRRRRLDLDFIQDRIMMSETASLCPLASVDAKILPSTTQVELVAMDMLGALASAAEAMCDGTNFCLQADGGRVGKPAELTYLFLLWCRDADRACVLPPQVFRTTQGCPRSQAAFDHP